MRRAEGQATVETVALVPLLVIVAASGFAVLAAGRASTAAGAAAHSAAAAIIQGRDPEAAARRALAGFGRRDTTLHIQDGEVRVTVRPRVPLLSDLLSASAEAHAGTVAARPGPLSPVRGGDGESGARAVQAPTRGWAASQRADGGEGLR